MRTEPSERWVRAYVGDTAVVDSRAPLLFWDDGSPVPYYAFSRADVRTDSLRPSEEADPEGHPFFGPRGPVLTWFDLRVGERTVPLVAWVRDAAELADRIVVSWEPGRIDRWLEEDEVVLSHPRDPFKRVDALSSSRHVTVGLDGQVLADSRDPVLLFETGLPTRYYVRPEDVSDSLKPVSHRTHCPYKGWADRYWNAPGADRVAWSYTAPDPSVARIAGRVAFYNEAVDIVVDGEPVPRSQTTFSAHRP